MTPEQLLSIGCQTIHWNPAYDGGYFEYYLPVTGDGLEHDDQRLSVTYGDSIKRDFMAWFVVPGRRIALPYILTIEQFLTMYKLLTGKDAQS